jgi:hypothetical protein
MTHTPLKEKTPDGKTRPINSWRLADVSASRVARLSAARAPLLLLKAEPAPLARKAG